MGWGSWYERQHTQSAPAVQPTSVSCAGVGGTGWLEATATCLAAASAALRSGARAGGTRDSVFEASLRLHMLGVLISMWLCSKQGRVGASQAGQQQGKTSRHWELGRVMDASHSLEKRRLRKHPGQATCCTRDHHPQACSRASASQHRPRSSFPPCHPSTHLDLACHHQQRLKAQTGQQFQVRHEDQLAGAGGENKQPALCAALDQAGHWGPAVRQAQLLAGHQNGDG